MIHTPLFPRAHHSRAYFYQILPTVLLYMGCGPSKPKETGLKDIKSEIQSHQEAVDNKGATGDTNGCQAEEGKEKEHARLAKQDEEHRQQLLNEQKRQKKQKFRQGNPGKGEDDRRGQAEPNKPFRQKATFEEERRKRNIVEEERRHKDGRIVQPGRTEEKRLEQEIRDEEDRRREGKQLQAIKLTEDKRVKLTSQDDERRQQAILEQREQTKREEDRRQKEERPQNRERQEEKQCQCSILNEQRRQPKLNLSRDLPGTIVLVERAYIGLEILEPWRQASSNHVTLSKAIQEIRSLGMVYFGAIDTSIETANDGSSFSSDAVDLCDFLLDSEVSEEDLRQHIQDMKEKAKVAWEGCTLTLNKFQDVRKGLNEIIKKVPEEVFDEDKTKLLIRTPLFGSESKRERDIELVDALNDLKLAPISLETLSEGVSEFMKWWTKMEAVLKDAESRGSGLRPGRDKGRVKQVRKIWSGIMEDYAQYKAKIIRLQDYYPSQIQIVVK